MTTAHRDLASPEYWERSLARSLHRRALVPRARREQNRRKRMAAVVASATMAGPATPLAFAAAPRDLAAEVASETPSQRAIEVRDGGLPLMLGSQGALVAQVQKALGIPADGIFGPQTDSAVRGYQSRAGMQVDGIVGPVTWAALFEARAVGGSNVPPQVKQRLERELRQAGQRLDAQASARTPGLFGANGDERAPAAPQAEAPAGGGQAEESPAGGQTEQPAAGGGQEPSTPVSTACGSSTLSSPVNGTVTSEYGPRWGRNHDGLDIAAPTGTAIRAAACGSVTIAGTQSGYGNIVCITHNSQFSTCYAHMSRFAVSQGAQVRQGQVIGYVGCTGSCTGPHVHFETRVNGNAQDPRQYLNGRVPGGSSRSASTAKSGAAGGSSGATTSASGGATAAGAEWDAGSGATASADSLAAGSSPEVVAGVAPASSAAPVEPVAPAPVEPVAAAPVEPVPVEPVPVEAAPVTPVALEPVAPAPVEPVAPAPVEPVPARRSSRSLRHRSSRLRSHLPRWRPLRSPRWRPSRSRPPRSRPRPWHPSP